MTKTNTFKQVYLNCLQDVKNDNQQKQIVTVYLVKMSKGTVHTSQFVMTDDTSFETFKNKAIKNIWKDFTQNLKDIKPESKYRINCK